MKGEREAGLNAGTSGLRWWSQSGFFVMQSKKFQNKEGQTKSQREEDCKCVPNSKGGDGTTESGKANVVTQQDGARNTGF